MSKGVIVHLDDDKKTILDPCKNYFDQLQTGLEYVCCTSRIDFLKIIKERRDEIKAFVFDLVSVSGKKVDLKKEQTDFTEQLKDQFEKLRVPIFLYSAHLAEYEEFKYEGTVFRIDKGDGAFETIAKKLKMLNESGFLDVFCPNGEIEKTLLLDLHEAFRNQFNSTDDIENIITTINPDGKYDVGRIQGVFVRIAMRSLMSKLHVPDDENLPFVLYNATEHYYKRISKLDFWTGDILKHRKDESHLLIITPRCNVTKKNHKDLLVCNVIVGDFPKSKEDLYHALTDKPEVAGYNRYIPPSPVFKGGKVELSKYKMLDKVVLKQNYDVIISLSEELTNEMLGKFGAYFFRTGITPWNTQEVENHVAAPAKAKPKI